MIPILLGILGCYVLAAASVHLAYALTGKRKPLSKHYVLIAGNEQNMMEWYMYSLRRLSLRTGREIKVSVIDKGCEDDTMRIAGNFARCGMSVDIACQKRDLAEVSAISSGNVFAGGEQESPLLAEEEIVVDLGMPAELAKLPLKYKKG
ncbi:hypothetical protein [Paenibacillus nasutitermitis]|uniref:Uncharacterized protein n=1 Tax=Paenibacillus nasutitermitis TaxID=1652958 RepID=A0A917E1H5_9BACL|nr:hypothetical protein [Paenibacillus nasutitermitis]GGD92304.1 hypothetical protein GCM10010911_58690 [Paenibacillus nasutitermitis]